MMMSILPSSNFLKVLVISVVSLETAYIIYIDGQALHSLPKSMVMLHRQQAGRHHNGYLLAIGYGLEGSPHGNFCFAKTHITTNQPIHGVRLFHIKFYIVGNLGLVGCVFIQKRRLQLGLQIAVGVVGIAQGQPCVWHTSL